VNSYAKIVLQKTLFGHIQSGGIIDDETFDRIYPIELRDLSSRHWTPVDVAKKAAEFLVCFSGAKVLDIGSGVGKFCFVGAASTDGDFTGVDRREKLISASEIVQNRSKMQNVSFLHSNITDIDFQEYDSFYFFNSFFENIDEEDRIDESVVLSPKLYRDYSRYVCSQLELKPKGTRLVTYWSQMPEVPKSYHIKFTEQKGRLKFWVKSR
jgi:SAM-dependent methyltransferase